MIIWPESRMEQSRGDYNREDAAHFIKKAHLVRKKVNVSCILKVEMIEKGILVDLLLNDIPEKIVQ